MNEYKYNFIIKNGLECWVGNGEPLSSLLQMRFGMLYQKAQKNRAAMYAEYDRFIKNHWPYSTRHNQLTETALKCRDEAYRKRDKFIRDMMP